MLLLDGRAAMGGFARPFGPLPGMAASGLLVYGLWELRHFQRQERVWVAALERTRLLAWFVLALAPSTAWWNAVPREPLFARSVVVLMFAGIALLITLNHALNRLARMLPDATVRSETKLFARVNVALFLIQAVCLGLYLALLGRANLPPLLARVFTWLDDTKAWFVLLFAFAPVALTMTLVWKAKEVVLNSAFAALEDSPSS